MVRAVIHILIWDAHTRTGHNIDPYAYGISHTRMGRPIRVWADIRIWGRTDRCTQSYGVFDPVPVGYILSMVKLYFVKMFS